MAGGTVGSLGLCFCAKEYSVRFGAHGRDPNLGNGWVAAIEPINSLRRRFSFVSLTFVNLHFSEQEIVQLGQLKQIDQLSFRDCVLPVEAVNRLKNRFPGCSITDSE